MPAAVRVADGPGIAALVTNTLDERAVEARGFDDVDDCNDRQMEAHRERVREGSGSSDGDNDAEDSHSSNDTYHPR